MMKRRMQAVALMLWALVLGFVWAGPAVTQGVTTSALRGTVTTPAGQPLADVQVTVRNTATGFTRTVRTGAGGDFFVPNLPPGGPYVVNASRVGFQAAERAGLNLVLNQTTAVDLRMGETAVALEGITVTGENNPLISPSRTGAATVIGAEEIREIPTIDRNFTDLAVVSPHVYVSGSAPSIGGANNRFNNIQIDGAVNNDVFGLAASGTPGGQGNAKPISIAAIQQFQVLIAPFDVRQTGFTGGLINAVTKSGTNEFQGSVYGYFRNQELARSGEFAVGSQQLPAINDFQRLQGGFTFGGPIIRDKLFFFTNAEIERRRTPTEFGLKSDPAQIRVLPGRIDEVVNTARQLGLEPGVADVYNMENPITNLFGRLDYTINDQHRMVLRHNFSGANDDDSPSRGGSRFELSSNTYLFRTRTNSTVLQFFSQFSENTSNEFFTNLQWIRDRRAPESQFRFSQIDVNTEDVIGGRRTRGTVRLGAEYFSQANELDQDIVEVTDNLTMNRGNHRLTLGATGQYLRFRNLFFPGSLGYYRFDNTADFAAGRPSYYEINLPFPGRSDPAARFSILQPGVYLQDEWSPNDRLTLTLGVRADVPFMLDEPVENPVFLEAFGRSTGEGPSGNVLFSPRLGFNWRAGEFNTTQLRGGVGIFSGRPPYVWLSNAFGNTGRETFLISCRGSSVPAFTPGTAPTSCAGSAPTAPRSGPTINLIDEDFRWPQDMKFDLAIDQELPFGVVATVEGIVTRPVNQIYVQELNLAGPQDVPASAKQGIGDRLIYGIPQNNRDFGFNPVRVAREFRNVVELTNNDEGYAYSLTGELRRTFFDQLTLRGAYTFSQVQDQQSLTSSIATSNYGFNPVGRSITDRPVTSSNFERPHKVVVQGTADDLFRRFGGTALSVVYVGASGSVYSYTYDGDVNGDGYEGPGLFGRNNDLLYVPNDVNEIRFASADDARLFSELIESEECLREQRGRIIERNSCRGPWTNLVNVALTQGLPLGGRRSPKIEVNVFNFLNLLNEEWGVQQGPFNQTVNALELRGRADPKNPASPMVFSYRGSTVRGDDGVTQAQRPLNTFFETRYQIQVGLRYDF
jgi:hypothetical protein